ncbi:MAG: hypothetical protein A4E37_00859 [Methanoregulaceae archaeon PtaB.Bin056]|nr:MAG: hypothetical protein A4E37_00859 [Methanoregulaceae archaeon PtaB.Bin056]
MVLKIAKFIPKDEYPEGGIKMLWGLFSQRPSIKEHGKRLVRVGIHDVRDTRYA